MRGAAAVAQCAALPLSHARDAYKRDQVASIWQGLPWLSPSVLTGFVCGIGVMCLTAMLVKI